MDTESVYDGASDMDMMGGFRKKKMTTPNGGFKGHMMKNKISAVVEGLSRGCWKCIQEDTGAVISSSDFWEQDISMLRRILKLETCSVPEISLFRACKEWSEGVCRKSGVQLTEENKREALGQQTLRLIRFPVMTVDEFQWEVVPSGMLCYTDVQSLLHALTNRHKGFGSSYNDKPRSTVMLNQKTRDVQPAEGSFSVPDKPVYSSVQDDPFDCMLGAELFRAFLKQAGDGGRHVGSNADELPSSPSGSRSRLPPLTPRGRSRGEPVPPSSPNKGSAPRKAQLQMVMGSRIDTELSQDGLVVEGGGRRPLPNDFCRLAPGLYRFRNEILVEIWLKDGEAMVTNHGHNPAVGAFPDMPVDIDTARSRLDIPAGMAEARGGVPLVAFLCRQ